MRCHSLPCTDCAIEGGCKNPEMAPIIARMIAAREKPGNLAEPPDSKPIEPLTVKGSEEKKC